MKPIKNMIAVAAIGAMTLWTAPLRAASIPGLFNTGVASGGVGYGAGGGSLADNAVDPHYVLSASPGGPGAAIVATSGGGFPIGPWLGDSGVSAWINPFAAAGTGGPAGSYVYETTFSLAGLIPETASITGGWAADDGGAGDVIRLNGFLIPNPANGGFGGLTAFTIPVGSPFASGINTLTFVTVNGGAGPTGVRVELLGTAALQVPEPSTITMLGLGLVAMLAAFRRMKK